MLNITTGETGGRPLQRRTSRCRVSARHPAAQQCRVSRHQPVAVHVVRRASRIRRYGVDASFYFFQNVNMSGYFAESRTDGPRRRQQQLSGALRLRRPTATASGSTISTSAATSAPKSASCGARDFRSHVHARLRFSPRPRKRFRRVRKFTYLGSLEYTRERRRRSRDPLQTGRFTTERQNSDLFTVEATDNYELLLRPFMVSAAWRSPGRLRVQRRHDDVPVRTAAAIQWLAVVAGRPVLRRQHHTVSVSGARSPS